MTTGTQKPPRRWSISTYAILFIALILILFSVVGWLALERMAQVRERIQQNNLQAARQELTDALGQVLHTMEQAARRLGEWDETRQQLATPTYYAYWRQHRLLQADILPSQVRDAEIYGPDGRALGRIRLSTMPADIPADEQHQLAIDAAERVDLLLFFPVIDSGNEREGRTLGYSGLRVDLLRALTELNRFRYVDADSLALDVEQAQLPEIREFADALDFHLIPNPEAETAQLAMRRAIIDIAFLVGALSLIFYILLMALLASPLRRLSQHIDTLRKGGGGLHLEEFSRTLPVTELEKVRTSLNEYQGELDEVHRDLSRKNRELWELAHLDALTGVYNRRAFEDDWHQAGEVVQERQHNVAFMLFDCNHFKSINDTYGHQVGDEVIRMVSSAVQRSLRHGDRLYRLGGDEFATLLLDCTGADAKQVAERCVEAVKHSDFTNLGIKEPVRISIGMSFTRAMAAGDLEDLHWQADAAMYTAKRPGSSHVAAYADNMAAAPKTLFSSMVSHAVYEAVSTGTGLEMHYQPVVAPDTGATRYYEALARIRREDELIMPYSIFPVVEARNLESDFDMAVLTQVLRDLQSGRIPGNSGVAINLSGPTLLHGATLEHLEPFQRFLEERNVVLEVTETALITQLDLAGKVLEQLRRKGFLVALDDFGSGYSSLRYLADMPADIIKFDISMIRSLEQDSGRHALIADLARVIVKAGYSLVAEGVETAATRRLVTELGFRYGQGYLFGRPEALNR